MKPRLLFYLDLDLDHPPRRLSRSYPRRSFLLYNFLRKPSSALIHFVISATGLAKVGHGRKLSKNGSFRKTESHRMRVKLAVAKKGRPPTPQV